MAHEHLIKGDYNDISSCHHLAFLGQLPSCKSLEVADPGSITRKQNGVGGLKTWKERQRNGGQAGKCWHMSLSPYIVWALQGQTPLKKTATCLSLLTGPTPDACPDLPRRGTLPIAGALARAELGHIHWQF